MANKCSLCKGNIETTFLGKIKGTRIGKKDYVCPSCQKRHKDKVKEMLKK